MPAPTPAETPVPPLEHSHAREAIRQRLAATRRVSYLRDFIYGGIDGAVTTLAVVAGVAGAALASEIILILGIANLLADGFSMAASNYSGTKAEQQEYARKRAVEQRHVDLVPEGEREEIRQIFAAKGITGPALEEVVEAISGDHGAWIDTMMVEEYGLAAPAKSPLKAGAATWAAFIVCGAAPLVSYAAVDAAVTDAADTPFLASVAATLGVFFAIGSAKSRWTSGRWWRSGLETLLVGSLAAALAFAAGRLVAALVG